MALTRKARAIFVGSRSRQVFSGYYSSWRNARRSVSRRGEIVLMDKRAAALGRRQSRRQSIAGVLRLLKVITFVKHRSVLKPPHYSAADAASRTKHQCGRQRTRRRRLSDRSTERCTSRIEYHIF